MPDLNSVPPSPHALAASRRASSHQMPPPPVPSSPSLNILPSNQNAVNNASSSASLPSPPLAMAGVMSGPTPGDNSAVGPGPGPLRHPRPLTAADLHLQLEKEQEAVVNRLTRELSLLRAAQNASVVSNTSSTSAGAAGAEPMVPDPQHLLSGSGFSIPSSSGRRHHRTSSNASTRSLTATAGSTAGISAPAPMRPSPSNIGGISLSRQNSAASRRSRANSPAPHSQPHSFSQSLLADPAMASYFHQRASHNVPASIPTTALGGMSVSASELSPGLLPATSRYEETAFYRGELESVKRENETLKRRVRELERMVRERRASDASRPRSESVSTTASVSVAASATGVGGGASIVGRRDRERDRVVSMLSTAGSIGSGVPEDEVRVGESAASAGLRGQEGGQGGQSGAA